MVYYLCTVLNIDVRRTIPWFWLALPRPGLWLARPALRRAVGPLGPLWPCGVGSWGQARWGSLLCSWQACCWSTSCRLSWGLLLFVIVVITGRRLRWEKRWCFISVFSDGWRTRVWKEEECVERKSAKIVAKYSLQSYLIVWEETFQLIWAPQLITWSLHQE